MPKLISSELVWIKDQQTYRTIIRRRSESRSYDVRYPGGTLRRNRAFLKSTRRLTKEEEDDDGDEIVDTKQEEKNDDEDRMVEDRNQTESADETVKQEPEPLRRSSRQRHLPKRFQYQKLGKPT